MVCNFIYILFTFIMNQMCIFTLMTEHFSALNVFCLVFSKKMMQIQMQIYYANNIL